MKRFVLAWMILFAVATGNMFAAEYRPGNIRGHMHPEQGRRRHPWTPTILADYAFTETAAGWTGINATVSDDTDFAWAGDNDTGGIVVQSIKLTPTGAATDPEIKRAIAFGDISGGLGTLRFKIYAGTGSADPARIEKLRLTMLCPDNSNAVWQNIYTDDCLDGWGTSQAGTYVFERRFSTTLATGASWTEVGSPDFATVTQLNLRLDLTNATDVPVVSFDLFEVKAKLTTPIFCMTFDDGTDDQLVAAAYFASKGIPCTFFVADSKVGTSGRFTWDNCRQLERMGHLVASHGYTHSFWLTLGLSESQCIDEMRFMSRKMREEGLNRGSRIFAQPGGTGYLLVAMREPDSGWFGKYADIYRPGWIHGPSSAQSISRFNFPDSDRFYIGAAVPTDTGVWTTVDDLVDYTISHGAIGVGLCHRIDNLANTEAFADALATHIANGDIKALTMADLLTHVWD